VKEDPTQQQTLLESNIFDNWNLVESQEDKLQRTRASIDRKERLYELHSIKRRQFTKSIQEFQTALDTFANTAGDRTFIKQGLDPNSRSAIITKIVQQASPLWLRNFQILAKSYDGISTRDLDEFAQSFFDSTYAKNVVGAVKDIGDFIYHGASTTGLTPRILMDICKRWSEILQRAFTELIDTEMSNAEAEVIEKMAFDALCGRLVRMHIDVAKKSGNALTREGILPQKWASDAEAQKRKIEHLKMFDLVDAKFGAPSQPAQAFAEQSSVNGAIDLSKAKTTLEKMLMTRTK